MIDSVVADVMMEPINCVQGLTHDLQLRVLILHCCLHIGMSHAVHHQLEIAGLNQHVGPVVVSPAIENGTLGEPRRLACFNPLPVHIPYRNAPQIAKGISQARNIRHAREIQRNLSGNK